MLQSVLFELSRMEIIDEGIVQIKSCLPEKWKSLKIIGIGKEKKEILVK